jgi:hypothetical protein
MLSGSPYSTVGGEVNVGVKGDGAVLVLNGNDSDLVQFHGADFDVLDFSVNILLRVEREIAEGVADMGHKGARVGGQSRLNRCDLVVHLGDEGFGQRVEVLEVGKFGMRCAKLGEIVVLRNDGDAGGLGFGMGEGGGESEGVWKFLLLLAGTERGLLLVVPIHDLAHVDTVIAEFFNFELLQEPLPVGDVGSRDVLLGLSYLVRGRPLVPLLEEWASWRAFLRALWAAADLSLM